MRWDLGEHFDLGGFRWFLGGFLILCMRTRPLLISKLLIKKGYLVLPFSIRTVKGFTTEAICTHNCHCMAPQWFDWPCVSSFEDSFSVIFEF